MSLYQEYFSMILKEAKECYDIANKVRSILNSPTNEVEVKYAYDSAERVEFLVGPPKIAEKIRELSKKITRDLLAFKIAEYIVYSLLGKKNDEEIIHQALSTALAVLTPPCITAAPSEGIAGVKIKKNLDGSNYLAVYFAGPIRSAGGTELAVVIVLADYIRRLFGLSKYIPTNEEIWRFIEELRIYSRRVSRFQFPIMEKLIEIALRNVPIEITGIPTDKILVPSFRNLPRIETNYLRGGALRVVNDGIIGRSRKVLKIVRDMNLTGWDWIETLIKEGINASNEGHGIEEYLEEVVGGRPVFSSSNIFGGLRIRYGRARGTGMATIGLHPITIKILKGYLVTGTQIKIDYPGKGATISPVSSIHPPIVLTNNGDVIKLDTISKFNEYSEKIDKILFLGDVLISIGDIIENNATLRPPGYCEEWWALELKNKIENEFKTYDEVSKKLLIQKNRLISLINHPFNFKPSIEEAIKISYSLKITLHPNYLFFWENISIEEFIQLRSWFSKIIKERKFKILKKFVELPLDLNIKKIFEKILMEHNIKEDKIITSIDNFKSLIFCLLPLREINISFECKKNVYDVISSLLGFKFREKAGSFISARMGRPEKAGPRKMSPPPNVLFPIGLEGGATRDILSAAKNGKVISIELAKRKCIKCGEITWKNKCIICNSPTFIFGTCEKCGEEYNDQKIENCIKCGSKIIFSKIFQINIEEELKNIFSKINYIPSRIKGVQGLTSKTKCPEILEKGILRAKYDLYVYKDGTTRFDSTNAPLTHFTPAEINTPIQKLIELGYLYDINGNPLISENQICELKIQDIILPLKAAEYLVKVSKFIDEILVKLCNMPPYYKCGKPKDLIGKLVVGLSPHTYVGVIGRIIGFTESNVCFAHPLWHAAKRRDCDGDEDSIMLLLDVLINYSNLYIPDKIGGKMDSPILITPIIDPSEVDEQSHNLDIVWNYPLEFYIKASEGCHINEAQKIIMTIKNKLNHPIEKYIGYGFTHPQNEIITEEKESIYKKFVSMEEKIIQQLALTSMLSSIKTNEVAEKILLSHLLPDIIGNARAFFSQSFRCSKCNTKYRRLPLTLKCEKCGKELLQTVSRKSIEKYVNIISSFLEKYTLNEYVKDHVLLTLENIKSSFKEDYEKISKMEKITTQISLEDFV
ncbi:MAG: DNA polymerase II large subunit [Nitrososphaerota archaeon]